MTYNVFSGTLSPTHSTHSTGITSSRENIRMAAIVAALLSSVSDSTGGTELS